VIVSVIDHIFDSTVREKNVFAKSTRARRTLESFSLIRREWFSEEGCSIPDIPPNAEEARPEIPSLDRFVVFEKDGHFPGFVFIGFSFFLFFAIRSAV